MQSPTPISELKEVHISIVYEKVLHCTSVLAFVTKAFRSRGGKILSLQLKLQCLM